MKRKKISLFQHINTNMLAAFSRKLQPSTSMKLLTCQWVDIALFKFAFFITPLLGVVKQGPGMLWTTRYVGTFKWRVSMYITIWNFERKWMCISLKQKIITFINEKFTIWRIYILPYALFIHNWIQTHKGIVDMS